MHNSPLKCQTNSDGKQATQHASPNKASPKLQSQAYKNASGGKNQSYASPDKAGAWSNNSPSPQKNAAGLMFGSKGKVGVEDSSLRSPPTKKYCSPSRDAKRSSPSKNSLPFGKPIEIIKSKLCLSVRIQSWRRMTFSDRGHALLIRIRNSLLLH